MSPCQMAPFIYLMNCHSSSGYHKYVRFPLGFLLTLEPELKTTNENSNQIHTSIEEQNMEFHIVRNMYLVW